jgi:hypothetical protein
MRMRGWYRRAIRALRVYRMWVRAWERPGADR